MPKLSQFQRAAIIGELQRGKMKAAIARDMGVTKSCVTKIARKVARLGPERSLKNSPGAGRPPKSSLQDVKRIIREIKKEPFLTAVKIKKRLALDHLSVRRIQEILQKAGYPARKAARKPLLTPAMKEKRLKFAQDHLHWSEEDWLDVMFSDESSFKLIRGTSKTVRRGKGDRFDQRFTVKTVKHPGSVIVWAGFDGRHGRAGMRFLPKNVTMNTKEYLDTLEAHMLPWYQGRSNTKFLQDGAPCHKSKKSMTWLAENGVSVMDWPGNSPDLNPIENMWNLMKRRLEEKQVTSVEMLKEEIINIWITEVSHEYCEKLARSMPRRLAKVVENQGGHTKY